MSPSKRDHNCATSNREQGPKRSFFNKAVRNRTGSTGEQHPTENRALRGVVKQSSAIEQGPQLSNVEGPERSFLIKASAIEQGPQLNDIQQRTRSREKVFNEPICNRTRPTTEHHPTENKVLRGFFFARPSAIEQGPRVNNVQ